MRAGPPHVVVQQVGEGGRYVPALAEVVGDAVVAVICDGSGAWDEGELGAELLAPKLLAWLVARPGEPLLDAVMAGVQAAGPQVGHALPTEERASFGVLVARVTRDRASVVSIGWPAAKRIPGSGEVSGTVRERRAAAGQDGETVDLTRIGAATYVGVDPGGEVSVVAPIAAEWSLLPGDTVLLARTSLAERLAGVGDAALRAAVAVNLWPDAVAALPPLERDEHRWSERRYSAVVVRVGVRP